MVLKERIFQQLLLCTRCGVPERTESTDLILPQ